MLFQNASRSTHDCTLPSGTSLFGLETSSQLLLGTLNLPFLPLYQSISNCRSKKRASNCQNIDGIKIGHISGIPGLFGLRSAEIQNKPVGARDLLRRLTTLEEYFEHPGHRVVFRFCVILI